MLRGAASEREAAPRWHSGRMKTFGAGLVSIAELGMYAGYSVLGWSLAQGVLGVVLTVALPVTVALVVAVLALVGTLLAGDTKGVAEAGR